MSGKNVVFMQRSSVAGSKAYINRLNLQTGLTTVVSADASYDLHSPSIDDYWVAWVRNTDIRAKNVKTGATKIITNDAAAPADWAPRVDGNYVVWWTGTGTVMGKNLTNTNPPVPDRGGPWPAVQPIDLRQARRISGQFQRTLERLRQDDRF